MSEVAGQKQRNAAPGSTGAMLASCMLKLWHPIRPAPFLCSEPTSSAGTHAELPVMVTGLVSPALVWSTCSAGTLAGSMLQQLRTTRPF